MAKKVIFHSKIIKVGSSFGLLIPKKAVDEGGFKEKKHYRVVLDDN